MDTKLTSLDQFKSWAKENGFIFPSSEIYGGFQAVYDFGHYGYLLKENIKNLWQKAMWQERDDVVSLDSGIFMHPKTWEASGHVGGFSDVLVEDKKTHKRYRADHLIEEFLDSNSEFEIQNSKFDEEIVTALEKKDMDKIAPEKLAIIIQELGVKSPDGNDLAEPRNFNLLVKSNLGTTDATFNEENVTYLRGETCQGIYLNYKNVLDNLRVKVPFGIAQVGKAFRNEIVARQFVFRTREFEQMELQYFIHPDMNDEVYAMWKEERINWYTNVLGIDKASLKFRPHEKLIFYAKAAEDVTYNFNSMGKFDEIEGIHARSDYDLSQHAKFSGQKLDYFDQEKGERYTPWIVEASCGLNRLVMMVIDHFWENEKIDDSGDEKRDYRTVLRLPKNLAPIKVAILPLSKKEDLQNKAHEVKKMLQSDYMTEYDETASIGKRYRRQDEIGTPYCVTIDFETLEDNAVTIRDRDSMQQERVKVDELKDYFSEKFS
ncbi:glycine--tRNA ligase [Candidatus Dojkabacteria bacterium]|uniref:Glycine--tRNA ligase n=1 Tax=Candidatus Dojkabacteria bacterium TaxID=2099670 RepID=A0A955RLS9_9BACT|nr:glycine--tRNA ligase [Candidatus Dojkabacteria bacterium]